MQKILQLVKSDMENPETKDKNDSNYDDLETSTQNHDITLLLKENVDKLVKNLK